MTRLYSDRSHYHREHRCELSDILRPFWKDMEFSDAQRKAMYGISEEEMCVVGDIRQADVAVLPMTWNHYVAKREVGSAKSFIDECRGAGLPIVSYVSGDEGVRVPDGLEDVWVVRASGFKSRKHPRQIAQPIFFEDPLKKWTTGLRDYGTTGGEVGDQKTEIREQKTEIRGQRAEGGGRRSEDRDQRSELQVSGFIPHPSQTVPWSCGPVVPSSHLPKIGFCGQASVGMHKVALDVVRGMWRNLGHRCGWRMQEPQPLYPPALLRARAMRILERSSLVETQFIARARYRAGSDNAGERERTTREFYQNIAETDYTLCVRGGGNFSKRFYETLAMGRIPVLVDTDCLLPFEPQLDWGRYMVRVPALELESLPERVAQHCAGNGANGLMKVKQDCRRIWEQRLTFGGFHRELSKHFESNNRACCNTAFENGC